MRIVIAKAYHEVLPELEVNLRTASGFTGVYSEHLNRERVLQQGINNVVKIYAAYPLIIHQATNATRQISATIQRTRGFLNMGCY
jgi:hypothetical protein